MHRRRRRLLRVADDRGPQATPAVVHPAPRRRAARVRRASGRSGTTRRSAPTRRASARARSSRPSRTISCGPIHNRMPVILPESEWDTWLDAENHDVDQLEQLLVPFAGRRARRLADLDARQQARQQWPGAARARAGRFPLMEHPEFVAAIRREGAAFVARGAYAPASNSRCRRAATGRSAICARTSAACIGGRPRSSRLDRPIPSATGRSSRIRKAPRSSTSSRRATTRWRMCSPVPTPTTRAGRGRTTAPCGFWSRRQAHELAVHRWDAQLAAGAPQPIDRALAADGIQELFDILPARPGGAPTGNGETMHLHCTDGDGEWLDSTRPRRSSP